jgi:hypothetical protein
MTFAAPSAIVGGGRKWMPFSAVDFLQALTAGILVGSAYALMCIGLGIIFGSMNVIGLELLEGLLFSVANWPLKGQAEFIRRAVPHPGWALRVRPYLDPEGGAGKRGCGRQAESGRRNPQNEPDHRSRCTFLPWADQV